MAAHNPRHLRTKPDVGPTTALAVETFAQPIGQFRRGPDFAARLGLVLRRDSSGGKHKLGNTIEDGAARSPAIAGQQGDSRDPQDLASRGAEGIMVGADAGTQADRGRGGRAGANKLARGIWAMLMRSESYRGPVLIGA